MTDTKNISVEAFKPGASVIQVSGRNFVDNHGRVLDLRGANVSSSSKVPQKLPPRIDRHTESSYVGRPFPLEEADEHWARLKSWGLTFLRINVTWEAIEHAGPGKYDQEYLDYLRALLQSMGKAGLVAYVSIHQDVWSRYSGGSGAPGWTLEAAGFDLSDDGEKLSLSGSAFLDGIKGGRLGGERGLWPTGYQKLACATMNTLFWGGSTFAPSFMVDGEDGKVNIQDYLQEAFLRAIEKLNEAVGDLDGVLGIELLNEPHAGFIGLPTLQEWDYNTDLHLGQCPSPLQSFALGSGHPTKIPYYVRAFPFPTRQNGTVLANPTSVSAWKNNGQCVWEREGVWRWSEQKKEGVALQDDYFSINKDGDDVDFYRDCYFPFIQKWNKRIGGKKMKMVGPIPNEFAPTWPQESRPDNFVYSPHWYDLNTLFKKSLGFMTVNVQGMSRGMYIWEALYFGRAAAKKNYELQIKNIVESSREKLGEVPVIIGETGVPMDINNEAAFKNGDFSWQERMMDHIISAMESSLIGFNLWAYNPLNRDDTGDDWNAENFSWYSSHNRDLAIKASGNEKSSDLNVGARLLDAIVRPYAIATAGTPLSIKFEYETSAYTYRFTSPARPVPTSEPSTSEVTELFLPAQHYTEGKFQHTLSAGGQIRFDYPAQRAYVWFNDEASDKGAKIKGRRIDIYVAGKNRGTGKISASQIGLFVIFAIFWLGVAYWTQMNEIWWDKKLGYTHSKWGTWGSASLEI